MEVSDPINGAGAVDEESVLGSPPAMPERVWDGSFARLDSLVPDLDLLPGDEPGQAWGDGESAFEPDSWAADDPSDGDDMSGADDAIAFPDGVDHVDDHPDVWSGDADALD